MRDLLTDKVYRFTQREGLFSAPCHVVVGVSGGADSMTLLHILQNWPEDALELTVVHVNHGIRGENADRDEQFVREYCEKHRIRFIAFSADVIEEARNRHISLEEAGRLVRYDCFEKVREECGADWVLTAHTADDQAETVLMRIVRGCGVDGLEGIAMKRGNVCRPLLCCTRSEIEEYCSRHNLRYVDDETNDNTQFLRNDVRHRLLPMLKEMNPSVVDALLRLSDCARSDAAYLNVQARELLDASRLDDGFSVATLLSQCDAVRRRALRLLLREIPLSSIEEEYILAVDKALLSGKGAVCVADGYRLLLEQGVLYVHSVTEDEIPGLHYIEHLSGDV